MGQRLITCKGCRLLEMSLGVANEAHASPQQAFHTGRFLFPELISHVSPARQRVLGKREPLKWDEVIDYVGVGAWDNDPDLQQESSGGCGQFR